MDLKDFFQADIQETKDYLSSIAAVDERNRKTLVEILMHSLRRIRCENRGNLQPQLGISGCRVRELKNNINNLELQLQILARERFEIAKELSSKLDELSDKLDRQQTEVKDGNISSDEVILKLQSEVQEKIEKYSDSQQRNSRMMKSIQKEKNELAEVLETALSKLKII
ncbi:hypothetical protein QAD02_010767 [Eretmocerus hayati]|uniref:Uncharacterized protein n=1 Tax=Eretmocerus hayati TaxID=131215 RepID=A0ACC2NWK6_9HYME|nr:hypothetical protein QAD02_010767 [Eretmocerus hayati]